MIEKIRKQLEVYSDPLFKFDPIPHIYTYDGEVYESVTTFLKQFHIPFDKNRAEGIALKLGVTKEEVLKMWEDKANYAGMLGTEVHEWIEYYYNKMWKELPQNPEVIDRIDKFNRIHNSKLYKLTNIANEVRIFSKKWKLAGTIDALFIYNNKLFIIDYKTNKELTTKNNFGEYLLPPFDKYDKCHLNEYSIQLSLYSLILKEQGIETSGGYLVHLGPSDEGKIYNCVDMRNELLQYFNEKEEIF